MAHQSNIPQTPHIVQKKGPGLVLAYSAIQYVNKRALMLDMDQRTHEKLGAPPLFADCLNPMAITVHQFFSTLHCLLPVNGGARENWLVRDWRQWLPAFRSSLKTDGGGGK